MKAILVKVHLPVVVTVIKPGKVMGVSQKDHCGPQKTLINNINVDFTGVD